MIEPYISVRNLQKKLPFEYAESHPIIDRCLLLWVSIIDITLEVLKHSINVTAKLAEAILNTVKAPFSKHYTIKKAIWCADAALQSAVSAPVGIIMAPAKLIYQIFNIIFTLKT